MLGLVYVLTEHELDRLFHVERPRVRPTPSSDEIVTISSSLHVEKRAKPVPPVARASQPRQPRAADVLRQVAAAPRPIVVREAATPAPSRSHHELAKPATFATSQPTVTKKARTITRTPAAAPHAAAAARTATASRPGKLSDAQLAQIERDLAKTIAQSRAQTDPLRNVKPEPPAAPKAYRMQMHGVFGSLHRGQGQYFPVRGWRAGGLDWYYVSYEFTYADGTYETGEVPWPIHFTPGGDPFVNHFADVQLPQPPPGYVPPGTLGKALRAYFPNLVFSNSDN
jgi:hypothetical protein